MWQLCSCRAKPGPRQGAEPRAAMQGVWGHQQWEALWHLRLQWLQWLLQAQRPQEAHLQVGDSGGGTLVGQGLERAGTQWGRNPWDGHTKEQGSWGWTPSRGRDPRDGEPVGQGPQEWTPSRTMTQGKDAKWGRDPRARTPSWAGARRTGTQWGRVLQDGHSAGQGPQGRGNEGGRGPQGLEYNRAGTWARGGIQSPLKRGQDIHQGRVIIGTGHSLGTGCPSGWSTCWGENTH